LAYLLDGKEGKLEAGEKLTIPPYKCHTFWINSSSGKDLVVHISVRGGENPGFDETFVRNFYGTLSSYVTEGKAPNMFQMLRYLDHADVILADVPFGLGRVLNFVVGRVMGGWLAGYATSYPIFSPKSQ